MNSYAPSLVVYTAFISAYCIKLCTFLTVMSHACAIISETCLIIVLTTLLNMASNNIPAGSSKTLREKNCCEKRLYFVFQGENCEYNYDDCLIQSCPDGFSCKDGINNVSCVPVKTDRSFVPPISVVSWSTIHPSLELQPTMVPVENLQSTEQPTGW